MKPQGVFSESSPPALAALSCVIDPPTRKTLLGLSRLCPPRLDQCVAPDSPTLISFLSSLPVLSCLHTDYLSAP